MVVCRACGQENPEGFRFCGACGAPLEDRPGREERKTVTVVFVDLVGFTQRAEQMDPEDVRALLGPYHDRARSELERFGGTVEKFIGDAVMALFGAPTAHEDDPERAVRAALAIRDWVRDDLAGLQLRIAVNTGEALIAVDARPEAGEAMASGDVINTAARIQSAAPANGILVGEATYRATRRVIIYREHEAIAGKGKALPIAVWEASDARSRFGVDVVRHVRSPLVGRERERALLADMLVRVREERSPQLVTLVGVPGIGKSRLVYELLGVVEKSGVLTYWRQGRTLPYGEGASFSALSDIIKAQAGIFDTDSPADAEQKLSTAVNELVAEPAEQEWVLSHLRPLVGVSASSAQPGDRQQESFTAWRRVFEAMAEERPLVLVFEDVHWAADGLLDFVDHLAEWATGLPLLLVCTARPELLERRSDWGGGKLNATTLSLSPLSDEDTARMLGALLETPVLDAEVQRRLLARAGGNPLYAEQYADMHSEGALLDDVPIPESVQGIIAARLDLLPAAEKQLLQDAAVLGKVFWLGALENGRSRAETEQYLHALERKGFVQRARRSSVADEPEHSFSHVLVRDTAYAQIPRAARAEKHRRVAEWLEGLGRPDEHADMLAYHYSSALELGRAAGQDVADLGTRARGALQHAGDRAVTLNAYVPAIRYFERALELDPEPTTERAHLLFRTGRTKFLAWQGGEDELETAAAELLAAGDREAAAEAETTLFEVHSRRARREVGDEHLARAWALLEDAPPSHAKANVLMNIALKNMLASNHAEAVETGRRAFQPADQLGIDRLKAATLNIIGVARAGLGEREGIADIERAAEIASEANAPFEVARAYNNLASVHWLVGDVQETRAAHQRCIDFSESYGQRMWRHWQTSQEAFFAYAAGAWERADAVIEHIFAELGEKGADYQTGDALALRALLRLARGDIPGAVDDAERGVEFGRLARDPQALYDKLLDASYVTASAGQRKHATAFLDEWFSRARTREAIEVASTSLVRAAWAAALLGRSDDLRGVLEGEFDSKWVDCARAFAAGDLATAADLCVQLECGPEEAYSRLRLAERLAAEGRRADADAELETALAFYRKAGATYFIHQAESLLVAANG
jgi:class 3 adenylate cyclase/tetratricopeptide (TPR) repeat protein